MPQAMKKKPANDVCIATLIMKHLHESCMDNRMWKLLWRKQWCFHSQTVMLVLQWCFLEAMTIWTMLTKATCRHRASGHEEEIKQDICIAKLAVKCLHKSCMDNRMQKLSWRNWWAMFSQASWQALHGQQNVYIETDVKKLMYNAYTARPTMSSRILHGQHNEETVVKKLMNDAYTARPTKKCLQVSCMDNRMKKLLWRNWWMMLTQQDLWRSVFKYLAWTTEWRNCCEETDEWCLHSKTYNEVCSRVLQRQLNGQQVVLPLLVHHCKQTEITHNTALAHCTCINLSSTKNTLHSADALY